MKMSAERIVRTHINGLFADKVGNHCKGSLAKVSQDKELKHRMSITIPKGSKLRLSYYQPISDLYMFNILGVPQIDPERTYSMRSHEFEWVI